MKKIGVRYFEGINGRLKEEKVYVPKNKELRIEIIWLHYNVLVVEYKRKKMTELVTRNY